METRLPDIPVKPKLFQYKIDYKKAAQYDYNSVELNQEQQIYVDFDMGMPLDLINREIYYLEPGNTQALKQTNTTALEAQLEQLRVSLLDERDRFLLSSANTYDTPLKKKPQTSITHI